ncbi:MAG: tetratricopeptide repeat protein, partial [Dactylosporangium sp.]|nr:tetratricopeptide repeat protein [Dactylosporangium sp.]
MYTACLNHLAGQQSGGHAPPPSPHLRSEIGRFCDNLDRAGARLPATPPAEPAAQKPDGGPSGDPAICDLAVTALRQHPDLWEEAYAVALHRGGVLTPALENLATREDTPLPLRQLAAEIPLGHAALRGLALHAALRTRPTPPTADDDAERLADIAARLGTLGIRLSEAGRREEALAPTQEAVTIRRRLAEASPGAFLSDLAMSLNNLGNRLSEAGRREEALAPTQEAVTIRRR